MVVPRLRRVQVVLKVSYVLWRSKVLLDNLHSLLYTTSFLDCLMFDLVQTFATIVDVRLLVSRSSCVHTTAYTPTDPISPHLQPHISCDCADTAFEDDGQPLPDLSQ